VQNNTDFDALLRALADETRRAIIDILLSRDGRSLFELCVELESRGLGMTRQGISRHLAVLADVGIVTTQWQGRTKAHSINTQAISDLYDGWLKSIVEKGKSQS